MLTIAVNNFRGIKTAVIQLNTIALLCGRNEQGKSSVIDAIRSVLNGTTAPYGLTKDELATQLVFQGETNASVGLRDDEQGREMVMTWPAAEVETTGAPFRSTAFATGARYFTDLTERERAQVLSEYLKTNPTEDEFFKATEGCGLIPTDVTAAWTDVAKLGWDGAWAKHKQEATKLKGGWDTLTGASYGVKVGANWRPKGWGPEHEALTDAELEAELKTATDELEGAIGKVAIGKDERAKFEGLAKQIPKLKELLETRTKEGQRAKATKDKAEKDYQAVPVVPPDKFPACPHCQQAVQVFAAQGGGYTLRAPAAALSEKKKKELVDQAEDAKRIWDEANKAYEDAQNSYRVVALDLQKAEDAKAQLESSDGEATKVDLEELRTEVNRVKSIIGGKTKIRDALKKHMDVMARLNLVGVLAPEGLRHSKLAEKLDVFNAVLAHHCDTAGWAPVTIDQAGDVSLNGIRYDLCARSGQMRCDVTLQVAFAALDGSEILLVDDADMMDGKGRNGLFALLASTEKHCVVGMMLTKVAQAPDLAAAELGATWWIDEAEAHPLEEYKAAQAA